MHKSLSLLICLAVFLLSSVSVTDAWTSLSVSALQSKILRQSNLKSARRSAFSTHNHANPLLNQIHSVRNSEGASDFSLVASNMALNATTNATNDQNNASNDGNNTNNHSTNGPTKPASGPNRNLLYRWITGLSLGAITTMWVASGNGPFSLGFLLASLIAQNEYYNMVKATGVLPAFKIGTVSSLMCFVTAAMLPQYHELVMPFSSTLLMIWLLLFNKQSPSINEISTSLLGMFYLGYLPSFWVRLRDLEGVFTVVMTTSPAKVQIWHRAFLGWANMANNGHWTLGSLVTWWTWVSIVTADVCAYFVGKRFGRHKLSHLSIAAGAASPNKTIEGALGGVCGCLCVATFAAHRMHWPYAWLTGAVYGLVLSLLALVGDLTASMMKRDAKMKDSGALLPGHGGLLDRIDSYMFTAPLAFFFCAKCLPWAMQFSSISSSSSGISGISIPLRIQ